MTLGNVRYDSWLDAIFCLAVAGLVTFSMSCLNANAQYTLPPSAVFPSGADCERPQSWVEQHECENFVFKQYGTAAGYAYIARMKEFNNLRTKKEQAARAATQEKQREEQKGKIYVAVSSTLPPIPGAIICPDYPALSTVTLLYGQYWGDANRWAMSKGTPMGQWMGMHEPTAPDPNLYGCVLVPAGAEVVHTGQSFMGFPIVTQVGVMTGITDPRMIKARP